MQTLDKLSKQSKHLQEWLGKEAFDGASLCSSCNLGAGWSRCSSVPQRGVLCNSSTSSRIVVCPLSRVSLFVPDAPPQNHTGCNWCPLYHLYSGPRGRALAFTCSSKMEQAANFRVWTVSSDGDVSLCLHGGGRDMKRIWPRQATNQIIIQQITLNQAPFADCIETWSHDCSWLYKSTWQSGAKWCEGSVPMFHPWCILYSRHAQQELMHGLNLSSGSLEILYSSAMHPLLHMQLPHQPCGSLTPRPERMWRRPCMHGVNANRSGGVKPG